MTKADDFRKRAKDAGKKAEESSSAKEAALQRKRQEGLDHLDSNEDWLDGKPGSQPNTNDD